MIDEMVSTILKQVKEENPASALRAVVTSAQKLERTYITECRVFCEENGKEYHCQTERNYYMYAVRVLDNNGSILEKYPELIEIESRQQFEAGDMVQVVFLGNELEAAIVGG